MLNRQIGLVCLNVIVSLFSFFAVTKPISAQITTDGTTKTEVTGNSIAPTGTGTVSGGNLYHSFDQFNVPTTGVTFTTGTSSVNGAGVNNIINRVTGADPSRILGTIESKTYFPNANLYLLNPNGVIFGANARLDIGGSFFATTGTGLNFNNGQNLLVDKNSLNFPSGDVNGIRFGVETPSAIINQGNLAVDEGKTISLTAGTVINTGTLNTNGGNVSLASVNGNSLVELRSPDAVLGLSVRANAIPNEWNGSLSTIPNLAEQLTGSVPEAERVIVKPDGSMWLVGKESVNEGITVEQGLTITSGQINTSNPNGRGGNVGIYGNKVALVNAQVNANGRDGGGTVLVGGDYKGEGTVPNAQVTFVSRNSTISSDGLLNGNGGKVIFWADDTTRFFGTVSSRGGALSGDGGFIEISGKRTLTFDGNVFANATFGKKGTVLFDPLTIVIFDGLADSFTDDAELNLDNQILEADRSGENLIISTGKISLIGQSASILLETTPAGSVTFDLTTSSPIAPIDTDFDLTVRSGTINFNTDNFPFTIGGTLTLDASTAINTNPLSPSTISAGTKISLFAPIVNLNGIAFEAPSIEIASDIVRVNSGTTFVGDNTGPFIVKPRNPALEARINFADVNADFLTITNLQRVLSATDFNKITIGRNDVGSTSFLTIFGPLSLPDVAISSIPVEFIARGTIVGGFDVNSNGRDVTFRSEDAGANFGTVNTLGTTANGSLTVFTNTIAQVNTIVTGGEDVNITSATGTVFVGNVDTSDSSIGGTGGNITLSAGSSVTVGNNLNTRGTDGGGDISINGGFLQVQGDIDTRAIDNGDGGSITLTSSTSEINLNTVSGNINTSGGTISGNGGSIILDSVTKTFIRGSITTFAENGNSGDLDINAGTFIQLSSIINTGNTSVGNSGNVTFTAVSNISTSEIFTESTDGNAGDINLTSDFGTISTGDLNATSNGAAVTPANVTLSAQNDINTGNIFTNFNGTGTSDGGSIDISSSVGSLTLGLLDSSSDNGHGGNITIGGASIDISDIFANSLAIGNGAEVSITATNDLTTKTITTSGESGGGKVTLSAGANLTSAAISTSSFDTNNGGDVKITGGTISIIGEGTAINASANNGTAGNVTINATNTVTTEAIFTNTSTGNGGNVLIEAQGNITFSGSGIFSDAQDGTSGNITITSTNGGIDTSAVILDASASGTTAQSGNITLNANGDIRISSVSTTNFADTGNAGTITLTSTAGSVINPTDVNITANGFNGNGGNITIEAFLGIDSRNGSITALSDKVGVGGNIVLTANGGEIQVFGIQTTAEDNNGGAIDLSAVGDIVVGSSGLFSRSTNSGNGGDITLLTTSGKIDTVASEVNSTAIGTGNGGSITFTASTKILSADILSGGNTGGRIELTTANGNIDLTNALSGINSEGQNLSGGDVIITAFNGDVIIPSITSKSFASSGGTIDIIAGGAVSISVDLSSQSTTGNGGNIIVVGDSIDVADVLSSGIRGGGITFNATNIINAGNFFSSGNGDNAGNVQLTSTSDRLSIGQISTVGNDGDGGNITLEALNDITFSGLSSSSFGSINPGNAGSIEVKSNAGSVINSLDVGISTEATNGNAGNITITAGGAIQSIDGPILANSGANGVGGNVTLTATNGINIFGIDTNAVDDRGGGVDLIAGGNIIIPNAITTTSTNNGAGNIIITTSSGALELEDLIAQSGTDGATIQLTALNDIKFNSLSVDISGVVGNGGSIFLTSDNGGIIFLGSPSLSAESTNGNGGSITITTNDSIVLTDINVSGADANAGNITLTSTAGSIEVQNLIADSTNASAGTIELIAFNDIKFNSLSVNVSGDGSGGSIFLTSNNGGIIPLGSSNLSAKSGTTGDGGIIDIRTLNSIILADVDVSATNGNGGFLNLISSTGSIEVSNLSAESTNGSGGSISLTALNDIQFTSLSVNVLGNGDGGSIVLTSSNGGILSATTNLSANSGTTGNGGNITISTKNAITLGDISVSATDGNAGTVTLTSNESIDVADLSAESTDGSGGTINLTAFNDIQFTSLSVNVLGNGDGGSIVLTSFNGGILSATTNLSANSGTTGNGGNITISTKNAITLGDISVSATDGNAGTVTLTSNESIDVADLSAESTDGSGGTISLSAFNDIQFTSLSVNVLGNGDGGSIVLNSANGGILGNPDLFAKGGTTGNGGNITVTTKNAVTLGDISVSATDGNAGNIILDITTGSIEVSNLLATSSTTGNGGSIDLSANGSITVTTFIGTQATDGDGGQISLTSTNGSINTDLINSFTDNGDGGNITFTSGTTITTGGITANNSGVGRAGNVNFTAVGDITTGFISTTAQAGNGGAVSLESTSGAIIDTIISTDSLISGDAGDITLKAGTSISTGLIQSVATAGNGGDVIFTAGTTIDNPFISVVSTTGNGGSITLTSTGDITLQNLFTLTDTGNGGDITINTSDTIILKDVDVSTTNGNAGNITFTSTAGSIEVNNLLAESTNGNGGIITISSSDFVGVTGIVSTDSINGQGGSISIDGDFTSLVGNLTANGFTQGGEISISGSDLVITGDLTADSSNGSGGGISIDGDIDGDFTSLVGNLTTTGFTQGGGISISGSDLVITGNITADSTNGSGGNISIASKSTSLVGSLTANGFTQGGEIFISGSDLVITGDLTADSSNGSGGNILVDILTGGTGNDSNLGNIFARGTTGGTINLISGTTITTKDIIATGTTLGGTVFVNVIEQITVGDVDVSASNGPGGTITLDPIGDVVANTLNAFGNSLSTGDSDADFDGGTSTGKDINNITVVSTGANIRILNILESGACTGASVCVGEGGTIDLNHGGKNPFVVGDSSLNGTAGTIQSGKFILANTSIPVVTDSSFSLNGIIITPGENINPIPESIEEDGVTFLPPPPNPTIATAEAPSAPPLQLSDVYRNEADRNLQAGDLEAAYDSLERSYASEFEGYVEDRLSIEIKPMSQMQLELNEASGLTGSATFAIYPIIFQDRLEILVIPPNSFGKPFSRRVEDADKKKILAVLQEYVFNLRDPLSDDYLQQAQQLYKWIMEPIEGEINNRINSPRTTASSEKQGNTPLPANPTLVFVMDGDLRVAPVSALHDGKQFLIEKYAVASVPSLRLTRLEQRTRGNARVIAMGLSEEMQGFAPLPAVKVEINTISSQLQAARTVLNEGFTVNALQTIRQQERPTIIHLATHAQFLSDSADGAFIQMWNERLPISRIPNLRFNDPLVEMLTLSACQTAVGQNLGIAGLAAQSGARSVLASLWTVSDAGTAPLMIKFYEDFNSAPSKALSLQEAQKALLRGDVSLVDGKILGTRRGTVSIGQNDLTVDLKHPFFWAPFILVGNWL